MGPLSSGPCAGSSPARRPPLAVPRIRRAALLACLLVALLVPTTASAADSIYWSTADAIRIGNLDGSGSASNLFMGESSPQGVAIDPAAGKLYWADSNAIRVGNLSGTGSPSNLFTGEAGPVGVAIDPAAGKLYWANLDSGAIRVGNLDGTGSPSTLFMGETSPFGVAIDPAASKIYWATETDPGAIRVASLDGSGSPSNLFTGGNATLGVAIEPAASKIFWSDFESGEILVGSLDGFGSPLNLFTGEDGPTGVAIDPAANRIYWADRESGGIRVGNLDGFGSPSNLFTGESNPEFTALLRSPVGTGLPEISGGDEVGEELSCSQGAWAPDEVGAFLYRAPESFSYQWRREGADIPGANQPTYTPTEPGSHACRVTASNQAGSTAQTSDPHQVNPPPPSCEDVPVSIPHDQPIGLSLRCSGQGTLTYELATEPADGALSDFDPAAGTLTYTPDAGFTGNDSFTYRASNSGGDSNAAAVRITVEPPPPTCEDVSHTTPFEEPAEVSLDCSGPGTLTYELLTQPAEGEISDFDDSAGTLTYTPDDGFFGEDSFAYRARNAGGDSSSATVTIAVSPRSNRLSFGHLSQSRRRGTATLRVRVPGPGRLRLARTKKVRPRTERSDSAAAVKLEIKPRRRARQRLRRHGRVRVRAKVTFDPDGGEPRTKSRRLRLRLRRR